MGELFLRRLSFQIYAHVVDQHSLREHGCGVGIAGPVAADCQVEYQKERLVEDPLPARLKVGSCAAYI